MPQKVEAFTCDDCDNGILRYKCEYKGKNTTISQYQCNSKSCLAIYFVLDGEWINESFKLITG